MSRARHECCALGSPEIIDHNIFIHNAGKQVSTIGKLNFSYTFLLNVFENVKLSGQNIAHEHLVLKRNNKMKSAGMEGNSETLFGKGVSDFLLAGFVVPNTHCFVPRASHN